MAKQFFETSKDHYINLDSVNSFYKSDSPKKGKSITLRYHTGDYYTFGETSKPEEYRYLCEWFEAKIIKLDPKRGADGKFRKEEVTDGA